MDGLISQLLAGAEDGGADVVGALELGALTVTVVVGLASGLLVEQAVNATAAATVAVETTASFVIHSWRINLDIPVTFRERARRVATDAHFRAVGTVERITTSPTKVPSASV